MAEYWKQYQELERHLHPVTVADVLKGSIAEGRVKELISSLPSVDLKRPIKTGWKRLVANFRLSISPQYIFNKRKVKKLNRRFMPPADIKRGVSGQKPTPFTDPFINWFAYYFDRFASEYGMSMKEFCELPFASLHEFTLAESSRKVNDSARRANEANSSKEGSRFLSKYDKRKVEIPPEIQLEAWEAELNRRGI